MESVVIDSVELDWRDALSNVDMTRLQCCQSHYMTSGRRENRFTTLSVSRSTIHCWLRGEHEENQEEEEYEMRKKRVKRMATERERN